MKIFVYFLQGRFSLLLPSKDNRVTFCVGRSLDACTGPFGMVTTESSRNHDRVRSSLARPTFPAQFMAIICDPRIMPNNAPRLTMADLSAVLEQNS
jgi:hypothetical protein